MTPKKVRVLPLAGAPFEIGRAHGSAYRDDIIRYTRDRIAIVESGVWSGNRRLEREEILDIAADCLPAHEAYAPDLVEELRGMAAATGLSLPELIITSGFTDFVDVVYRRVRQQSPLAPGLSVDACTAFLVPDRRAGGAGFFGQTWDMHDSATEFVIMLDLAPADGPEALVFTTVGCVGQIGMNEHGIAVGINNLMGADGRPGVTWPFVVRKVLQQENITDALACITDAPLAGAHNYLLFDRTGTGYNIEAMATRWHVEPLGEDPLVHTNHCLVPETLALSQERPPESQTSSETRLALGYDLLEDGEITVEALQELTRTGAICARSAPPFHVESCGAAIMRPKTGEFWAVWGLPVENEYERFVVGA